MWRAAGGQRQEGRAAGGDRRPLEYFPKKVYNRVKMLLKIYHKLLKYFGPQGWWPVNGRYDPSKKTFSRAEKFEIMVGAILTQNTSWKNVEKALSNLRKEKLLDATALSEINIKKLQRVIRPSGFFKQKASRLKNFARCVRASAGRSFNNITREYLLSLNGIGPETADSIMLYALGKPSFVVDSYTKRLLKRTGIMDTDGYETLRQFFQNNLPADKKIYGEYHALIVALAKKFCKKIPECGGCPISADCKTATLTDTISAVCRTGNLTGQISASYKK